MFKFPDSHRIKVETVVNMMAWANNEDHKDTQNGIPKFASQSSVYGCLENVLNLFVEHFAGEDVLQHIDSNWNWGGYDSHLEDCEVAIEHAIQDLKERDEYRQECEMERAMLGG